MFGFKNVARACHHQKRLAIGHDQHRLQLLQVLVGAPVLGKLDTGAGQLARCGVQLLLQPFKQREGIGGRSGKAGHVAAARRQPADLAGGALDHRLAKAHLAVARHHDLAAPSHADDRRAVPAGKPVFGHCALLLGLRPIWRAGARAATAPNRRGARRRPSLGDVPSIRSRIRSSSAARPWGRRRPCSRPPDRP